MGQPIGSIPSGSEGDDLVAAINTLVQSIELRFLVIEETITDQQYTTTNVTPDRSLDADTALLAEVADVLGTLIEDLKTAGRLP